MCVKAQKINGFIIKEGVGKEEQLSHPPPIMHIVLNHSKTYVSHNWP